MFDRVVKKGSFEPGMKLYGKIVESWHLTDTRSYYAGFSMRYTAICLVFTDGTKLHVMSEEKVGG